MYCCYTLECAFQYLAEVVVGWGAPSAKRRGAKQNAQLNRCPHLSKASRDDSEGGRSSAVVSIHSAGAAKEGAGWEPNHAAGFFSPV